MNSKFAEDGGVIGSVMGRQAVPCTTSLLALPLQLPIPCSVQACILSPAQSRGSSCNGDSLELPDNSSSAFKTQCQGRSAAGRLCPLLWLNVSFAPELSLAVRGGKIKSAPNPFLPLFLEFNARSQPPAAHLIHRLRHL